MRPRIDALREHAVPVGLCLSAFALWFSLPDATFVFDGVMFAQSVERATVDWRYEFFNSRHLVFNATFQLLRDALIAMGLKIGAYRLFQIVNSAVGAAGLFLFADMVRRLTRDRALGWCAALLLGATWCYGTRATEGQVYMLMSAGALATFWTAVLLLEKPSALRAAGAATAFVAATIFHSANGFLFPTLAVAYWRAFGKRRAQAVLAGVGALALLAIPFLIVFRSRGSRAFFAVAADYHGSSGEFWAGLFHMFWGGASLATRILTMWKETGLAFAVMPPEAGVAVGLGLWAAAAGTTVGFWNHYDLLRKSAAITLAAGLAGYSIVNLFWPGGLFFYVPPHACLIGLIALGASNRFAQLRGGDRRSLLGGLCSAGVSLGAWNVGAGLVPQSHIENNVGHRTAVWVGEHTVPSSLILITGFGFPSSKVYLGSVAMRGREVLEYFFNREPKAVALREISVFSAHLASYGVPMYFLSDLIESPKVAAEMKQRWNVEMAEIQQAFGPGRVVRVAESPDERVYLYVPKTGQAELFVCVGYSILSETNQARLGEHVGVLKEIVSEMSPTERRRAAGLMKTRNWGFDLLAEGLRPYMGKDSAVVLAERRAHFQNMQVGANFWFRVGNLYKLLGLKPETLDAWARAEKTSNDPGLRQAIDRLKATP